MTTPRHRRPEPGERGFVLVGVVMFILALTIIGLTLFDLSGYEAQFFERTVDEEQAYQLAMGGVEWTQWALGVQNDLRVVRSTPLPAGITYARARYADTKDSTAGYVDWSGGRLIEVRVLAQHHMARRMVEVTYRPKPPRDYWKRLFSLSGGLTVVEQFDYDGPGPLYSPENRSEQTRLIGSIWQTYNVPDTLSWLEIINEDSEVLHPIHQRPPLVPVPDLDLTDFYARHWATAVPVSPIPDAQNEYHLDTGSPTGVNWYKTEYDPGYGWDYSLVNTIGTPDKPNVFVNGKVVWMFDRGAYFDQPLRVFGTPGSCLVLVSPPGIDPTKPAFEFHGGLESADRPLFIATSGDVSIDLYNTSTQPSGYPDYGLISRFSVYARNLLLMGPEDGMMRLIHDPSPTSDLNKTGGVVEQLYTADALPMPTGAALRGTFQPMAGTWREVTESNPD